MKYIPFVSMAAVAAAAALPPPSASQREPVPLAAHEQQTPAWVAWQPAQLASLPMIERIDQAIRSDRKLSLVAEHVKVLAINDTIMLAGWVESQPAREALERKAKEVAEGLPLESAIAVR